MMKKSIVIAGFVIAPVAFAQAVISPMPTSAMTQLKQRESMLKSQLQATINQLVAVKIQLAKLSKKQQKQVLKTGFNWVLPGAKHAKQHAVTVDPKAAHPVTICQASYYHNLYPGALNDKACMITYAGLAYKEVDYKVLVSKHSGYWLPGDQMSAQVKRLGSQSVYYRTAYIDGPWLPGSPASRPLPANMPVIGGHENGHYVYVCRAKLGSQYQVGKYVTGACDIPMDGKEARIPVFEVLYPKKP